MVRLRIKMRYTWIRGWVFRSFSWFNHNLNVIEVSLEDLVIEIEETPRSNNISVLESKVVFSPVVSGYWIASPGSNFDAVFFIFWVISYARRSMLFWLPYSNSAAMLEIAANALIFPSPVAASVVYLLKIPALTSLSTIASNSSPGPGVLHVKRMAWAQIKVVCQHGRTTSFGGRTPLNRVIMLLLALSNGATQVSDRAYNESCLMIYWCSRIAIWWYRRPTFGLLLAAFLYQEWATFLYTSRSLGSSSSIA